MHKERRNGGQPNLAFVVELWATPDAQLFADGEEPETFLSRQKEIKAKKVNGNGMGTPLAMQGKLWATPLVADAGEKCTTASHQTSSILIQSALWALPTTRDHKDGSAPSEESPTNGMLGRQAPRMTEGGKWFLPLTPNSPLRYRLNPRFVAWLQGIPWSWITPDGLSG